MSTDYKVLAKKEMRQRMEDSMLGYEREHYHLSIEMKAAELGLLSSVAAVRERAGYRLLELMPDLEMLQAKIEVAQSELSTLKPNART